MIDQKLRIYAKQTVKKIFIVVICFLSQRTPGNISHSVNSMFCQLSRISLAHPPEIRQRAVIPESAAVGHLIQPGDPHPVFICRDMLCPNIHSRLAQIQVRPDTGSGSDPCIFKNIQNDLSGQFPGGKPISL